MPTVYQIFSFKKTDKTRPHVEKREEVRLQLLPVVVIQLFFTGLFSYLACQWNKNHQISRRLATVQKNEIGRHFGPCANDNVRLFTVSDTKKVNICIRPRAVSIDKTDNWRLK